MHYHYCGGGGGGGARFCCCLGLGALSCPPGGLVSGLFMDSPASARNARVIGTSL